MAQEYILKEEEVKIKDEPTPTNASQPITTNVLSIEALESHAFSHFHPNWIRNTIENQNEGLLDNDIRNLPSFEEEVVPVVCGSGPTLTEHISVIRNLPSLLRAEGKVCLIFANQSNFSYLLHEGITPDFVCATDSNPVISDILHRTVPSVRRYTRYLLSNHCSPKVMRFASHHGTLFSFKHHLMPHTDHRAPLYNTFLDILCPQLSTFIYQFGNVSNARLLLISEMVQLKKWKVREILMSGVDNSWWPTLPRVPYFNANGKEPDKGWHKIEGEEELSPSLVTNQLMRFYDGDLKMVTEGLKQLYDINFFVNSHRSLSGPRYPIHSFFGGGK